MFQKVRLWSVRTLNFTLMILIVFFLLTNRVSFTLYSSSPSGQLPNFDKVIDYTYWDGKYSFSALPNPYEIKTTSGITNEYISFTKLLSIVQSGENFDLTKANDIKQNKIIRIDNARELLNFSELANSKYLIEKQFYLSAQYCLGGTIDFLDYPGYFIYPIGNNDYPFVGVFDGQGFEIKNLMLADEEQILELYNQGLSTPDFSLFPSLTHYALFSNVGEEGQIRQLGLVNPILRINFPRPQPPLYPVNMRYAASLVGINLGTIEYVYVIDDRDYYNAGLDVRGGFLVSGILAENNGTFKHAYFVGQTNVYSAAKSTAHYKPIVYLNHGVIADVYFDSTVYQDRVIDIAGIEGKSTNDLITQNECLIGDLWKSFDFSNIDSNIEKDYPKLIGLLNGKGTLTEPFLITNPIDLIFFSKMIDLSSYFRDKTYRLTNCIDMRQVSSTAYLPPVASFSGILDGAIDDDGCLYEHPINNNNHAIISFELSKGVSYQDQYLIGLFSQLTGTVKNINFINGQIHNLQETSRYRGKIFNIGIIAAVANDAIINNVHTNSNIDLNNSASILGLTNVGGLVGYGDCSIVNSSNSGNIKGGVHEFINDIQFTLINQTMGGLLGSSFQGETEIVNSFNVGNIEGFSYLNYDFNASFRLPTLIGGVVGNITSKKFIKVSNQGEIFNASSNGINNITYLGGIFGKYSNHNGGYHTRHSLVNTGSIYIIPSVKTTKAAGIGIVQYTKEYANEDNIFLGLRNEGSLYEPFFSEEYNYDYAGLIYDIASNLIIYNGINRADFNLNLYHTSRVNPIYFSEGNENNFDTILVNCTNYGNILLEINSLVSQDVFISGLTTSQDISLVNCFNYGNIRLDNFINANVFNIYLSGLINIVNYSRLVKNSHNEGDIYVYIDNSGINLYIGGIANLNNLTPNESNNEYGHIINVTNNGLIETFTNTTNHIIASGIVNDNKGIVSDAANLNDIAISNPLSNNNVRVYIGGVAGINSAETSQIMDSVNYGNLYGRSARYALVGGILADARNRLSIVNYAINYGDIYSFGFNGPSLRGNISFFEGGTYHLNPPPFAVSGGIIATGLSSFNNCVNKGTVASNDVAGGIFGVVNATNNQVTQGIMMTDSINYGQIKFLQGLSIDITQESHEQKYSSMIGNVPDSEVVALYFIVPSWVLQRFYIKKAFGGFIGFIWQQSNDRAVERIQFRYLLNTDSERNFIGRCSRFLIGETESTEGNTDYSTISTTNQNDNTDAPFYNNIRTFLSNDNNTININKSVLNTLGVNEFAFNLNIINVDDNGIVIGTTTEQRTFNVTVINELSMPYSKYRTFNYVKGSSSGAVFDLRLFNNIITHISNNQNVVNASNYYLDNEKLIFFDSYLETLPLGINSFEIYYNDTDYITVEINVLDKAAFDNEFLNFIAENYTYNLADTETYLNILVDLNYNIKATLLSIFNLTTSLEVGKSNYQYIGIYSENFFMRKDSIFKLDAEGNRVYLLHDYIFYLTNDEIPEQHQNNNPYGMYAISTSKGRTNGALLPVNIDLDSIDQTINNQKDSAWREVPSSGIPETINEKFANMKQIGKSKQTTIFNLILEDVDNNEHTLSNPYINSKTNQIIYYVNNDTPLGQRYQVKDYGYQLAFGAKIYSKYYGEESPLNEDISVAEFSPSVDDDKLYGSLVVVAEETSIYTLWEVRVIVINQIQYTEPTVKVNENIITEFVYDTSILEISNTQQVHFKNGTLEVNFRVFNLPNGYDLLQNISVYENDIRFLNPSEFIEVDKTYYSLSDGIVKADLFGEDTPNPYWLGNVNFKITLKQTLHTGKFYLALTYYSKIYLITFEKMISNENYIYNFSHQTSEGIVEVLEFPTSTNNGYIYSQVNYGQLLNFESKILLDDEIPSYLETITISPFARISDVSFINFYKQNNYYTYVIHLTVIAENGTERIWIHEITEKFLNPAPYKFLKDGNPVNMTEFSREEQYVTFEGFFDISKMYGGYDFINYSEPIYRRLANQPLFELDKDYQEYLTININDSLIFSFNNNTLPGEYKVSFTYHRTDYLIHNGDYQSLEWNYDFDDIVLIKKQNTNTYISNITFVGGSDRTRFPEMYCLEHTHGKNHIIVIQNGIIYGEEVVREGVNRCQEFNIIGYVSNINLLYYSPIFDLPIGANIVRFDGYTEQGEEIWSNDLNADFTQYLLENIMVKYKVISEDGKYETIYNVGVIDITYNVRFMYNIVFTDGREEVPIPEDLLNQIIFISFTNYNIDYDENYNIININGIETRMNLLYMITLNQTIRNHPFNFNMGGYYSISVELPCNYEYQIEVNENILPEFGYGYEGKSYFVQPSTKATTHYVTIYISPSVKEKPWGINKIWNYWKNLFS